uniref:Probable G-protein coupled receptor Mth-like 12 n=1 Tax=Drosophila melanogaster TaxID=7227 RepID=MTH12_DROME|nr:methuselah-like 12 [Drosophila melanogaster]P83119.2 RecName: Full=Probable G-protein coupled receptor Mth-like 12; AltName: Full=Protein methuselah-like 12; Flags: Precursor [Drosophila melanogaster]AAN13556.2 methuselah-like 12 [Drosophila melanogaster]|eukprot:NP_731791.2 methuselah-like 12 [Drosophila melanogaster]
MFLWLKCFCTLIIVTIAKNSSAKIPHCKYDETINISHFKRLNDAYIYEHFEIPANLTGEFDYKELMDGSKVPTEFPNLRGCICKVRPCIRICCARKNILSNGECSDGVKNEIKLTMLDLTMQDILLTDPTLAELNMIPQYNSTELLILREQFQPCDEIVSLKRDEYTILKDGSILLHTSAEILSNDQYCLYPEIYSDFPETIRIINRRCYRNVMPGIAQLSVISVVGFILTLAVYLSVEKLRNLLGKCLICSLFSMFMEYFIWTMDYFRLLQSICSAAGYMKYFFSMSSYLWFSVVSFHLWELFTSLNRHEPQYRFLIYNTFVWCTAAIPTVVIFSMNQMWENDPGKSEWLPLVGYFGCSVKDWNSSSWFYSHIPIVILNSFNVIMFVLTAIYIWKVKKGVKSFAQHDERNTTCLEFNVQTYIQFVRLFLIMGASWLLDQLTRLAEDSHLLLDTIVLNLTVYLNAAFGILIFVLLILKGSTFKMIMER